MYYDGAYRCDKDAARYGSGESSLVPVRDDVGIVPYDVARSAYGCVKDAARYDGAVYIILKITTYIRS